MDRVEHSCVPTATVTITSTTYTPMLHWQTAFKLIIMAGRMTMHCRPLYFCPVVSRKLPHTPENTMNFGTQMVTHRPMVLTHRL